MATKKKKTKLKLLSSGRPPTVKPERSISSKATRTLIRTHHTLEKEKAKALANGDDVKSEAIAKQIELNGGLKTYQRASLTGQSSDRGGDSSKVLMEWLAPVVPAMKKLIEDGEALQLLEVGALSTTNACSKSRLFEVERIDLNSQAQGIKQQDFMERPLPDDDSERFDMISLSLVLNYVPDALGRGAMLRRTIQFLKSRNYSDGIKDLLPCLFLVLPASCVTNSRYLDEGRLENIMEALGFVRLQKKLSNKLVYYLWRMGAPTAKRTFNFKKQEIRSGQGRNNFAIVLK